MNNYDDLKKLAEKATPGPWVLDHDDTYVAAHARYEQDGDWDWITGDMSSKGSVSSDEDMRGPNIKNNCRFIAAANPERIKQLIEELQDSRALTQAAGDACDLWETLAINYRKELDELARRLKIAVDALKYASYWINDKGEAK